MKKAVFLDRDGTINDLVLNNISQSPKTLKDLKLIKNIITVSKYLKKKNYLLIMITNQPDVSRGVNTKKNVNEINNFIKKKINLDDIYVCFSKNDKNFRRKPNPGMLLEASQKWKVNMKKSYIIGDRIKDMITGKKAGCKTILFNKKKIIKKTFDSSNNVIINHRISNLKEIYKIII